jgi:hypothetical protein
MAKNPKQGKTGIDHKHYSFKYVESQHAKLYVNLNQWKIKADEYYRAGEYLFLEIAKDYDWLNKNLQTRNAAQSPFLPHIEHPYILIIGNSIENLIKACMISADKSLIGEDKVSSKLSSHNLDNLIKQTTIKATEDQLTFLKFLSYQIYWASKYPIPLEGSERYSHMGYSIAKVREAYLELYHILSETLQQDPLLNKHLHNYTFDPNFRGL